MPESEYQARTLPRVVADAAATHGERIAITDGDVQLSYAELDDARIGAARAFVAAGLEKATVSPSGPPISTSGSSQPSGPRASAVCWCP